MRIIISTILCCGLAFSTSLFSQTIDVKSIEDQVYNFNNKLNFKASQELLLSQLHNNKLTAQDRYHVYRLLSYTHKRLFDYTSVFHYLNKAYKEIKSSDHDGKYLAEINAQRALAHFDIHEYAEADKLLLGLEANSFKHLNNELVAKLQMQRAYLQFLDKDYLKAEATYNLAIAKIKGVSMCDLPMALVKKMQLYEEMGDRARALENYHKALYYADSCGILKYAIYAKEELRNIYKRNKEFAAMGQLQDEIDKLDTIYKKNERLAEVNLMKENLETSLQEKKIKAKNRQILYIIAASVLLGILCLGALYAFWQQKNKRKRLESEFLNIKSSLQQYADAHYHQPSNEFRNIRLDLLNQRQQEVLELIARGLSNKEIAEKLFISENTVKYHIKNIYLLLEIKDRKEFLVRLKSKGA